MYTITPKQDSKVVWCEKYGDLADAYTNKHIKDNCVLVCLYVFNGEPIIRVCYSRFEHEHTLKSVFSRSSPCRWYWVPISIVQPFMQGQEISNA